MKFKLKINTNVFFGFLAFMSFVFFLLSFLFEGTANVVFLSLSFAVGEGVLILDFFHLRAPWKRYNPLFYAIASLIVFAFHDFYSGLLLILIYAAFLLVNDFLGKTRLKAEDNIKNILGKRYHKIVKKERVALKAEEIQPRDKIELLSGETVPVDGTVLSGAATVTNAGVDSVSNGFQVSAGDFLVSGAAILSGEIIFRAETDTKTCTAKKMVDNKDEISKSVTNHEKKILKVISLVMAAVLAVGVIAITVLSIVFKSADIAVLCLSWLSFILCADVFRSALHNSYVLAAKRCANNGIAVKNKQLIEKSMFIKNLLFRKQGVLTSRKPVISKIVPIEGVSESELMNAAAYAQFRANHILSVVIENEYGKKVKNREITYFQETEDNGAMVQLSNGTEIITGTAKLLSEYGIVTGIISEEAVLCVAINNVFVGHIVFEYKIKDDIKQYVDSLKYAGAKNLMIITRDSERATKAIALKSGIKNYISELDSEGIVENVNRLGKNTVYIGFGKGDSCIFGKECSKLMYGGFQYDSEHTDGILLSDGLGSVLKFFNIIKDTRWNLLLQFAVSLAVTVLLCCLLFNASTAIAAGGFIVEALECLVKLNEKRLFKKL